MCWIVSLCLTSLANDRVRACSDAGQGETQSQAEFACANLIQNAVTGIRDDYNGLSNAREFSRAYLAFHDRRPFDLTIKLSVTAASLAPSQHSVKTGFDMASMSDS